MTAGLVAGGSHGQDSTYRDEALAYSQAIVSAWTVLERHIRDQSSGVTLIDGLTSTSALTAMGWQDSWTDLGPGGALLLGRADRAGGGRRTQGCGRGPSRCPGGAAYRPAADLRRRRGRCGGPRDCYPSGLYVGPARRACGAGGGGARSLGPHGDARDLGEADDRLRRARDRDRPGGTAPLADTGERARRGHGVLAARLRGPRRRDIHAERRAGGSAGRGRVRTVGAGVRWLQRSSSRAKRHGQSASQLAVPECGLCAERFGGMPVGICRHGLLDGAVGTPGDEQGRRRWLVRRREPAAAGNLPAVESRQLFGERNGRLSFGPGRHGDLDAGLRSGTGVELQRLHGGSGSESRGPGRRRSG